MLLLLIPHADHHNGYAGCLQVQSWYTKSFQDLRSFPAVKDAADDENFTTLLQVHPGIPCS